MILSVALITHNEAKNLRKLLPILQGFADEICVVDMYSSDETASLVKAYGGKLFLQTWQGYAEQKNTALDQCSGKWILSLDADEVPSPAMIDAIKKITSGHPSKAYKILRKTHYQGKLLRYAWQPDWQLRLFPKGQASWTPQAVHETLQTKLPVEKLPGYVTHYSYKNLADHYQKTIKYARLMGQLYFEKGKKAGLLKMLFSPAFAFCKAYFWRLGMLDGVPGLIACASEAHYTALKYFYLWELNREASST